MSWFKNIQKAATQTFDAVKIAAETTYNDLKSYPTEHPCSGCDQILALPPNLFVWECEFKHVSPRHMEVCTDAECTRMRPANLTKPKVACAVCGTVTEVSTTNFMKHVKVGAKKTKVAAKEVYVATKATIDEMKKEPTSFHCKNCDQRLQVPQGKWACQKCAHLNEEEATMCAAAGCPQKKTQQMVICGVCQQSTPIPSTNFSDTITHEFRNIKLASTGAYYFVAKKPFVDCLRCNNKCKLPELPKDGTSDSTATVVDYPKFIVCPVCGSDVATTLEAAVDTKSNTPASDRKEAASAPAANASAPPTYEEHATINTDSTAPATDAATDAGAPAVME